LEALKVLRHYPLTLLTKVGWRHGKNIDVQKTSDRVVCFGQAADHRN
jgi:hypothetical protein